ncbi:MAG: hypothetical protein K2N89_06130 [Lachnospiraceae bacterium]|nr:hypothetical protein [Lachnospiraceae bacterium]
MDELLKKSLTPMDEPSEQLNAQVLRKIKERKNMSYKRRISVAILVAVCTLLLGSVTVVAARRYLSPAEVAEETHDSTLKNAFLSEGAVLVNETQEYGGYRVTLLGSVSGKSISDYLATDDTGTIEENKIYTVVAIERADGTPMPDTSSDEYGKESFYVSHYIRGLNPREYSIMSMGGGYSEMVKDGIQYRIMEMDNIEMFADREIYVGVSLGTFYDAGAYCYEESSGIISRNPEYNGLNALFLLPVDKSKADPEAAEAYLKQLRASWDAPSAPPEKDDVDLAIDEFINMLTPENLDEYAAPVESTRMVYTPNQEGIVFYAYDLGDDGSGSGEFWIMPEMAVGEYQIAGYSYSENGLQSLVIDVFVLNEDGTVTYVVYQPKK